MADSSSNLGDPIEAADTSKNTGIRPWIGVHFLCSNYYLRVYRDRDGTRYLARCPRCNRCTQFRVGQGGTAARQFEVSCGDGAYTRRR